MSFFDFSYVWEFLSSTSPVLIVIGVGLVIFVRWGVPWLVRKVGTEVRALIKSLEILLTIFFLLMAMPGLAIATMESRNDPRVILLATLALELILLGKFFAAIKESRAQQSEVKADEPLDRQTKRQPEPVPTWATLGVIAGVSALVLMNRKRGSSTT